MNLEPGFQVSGFWSIAYKPDSNIVKMFFPLKCVKNWKKITQKRGLNSYHKWYNQNLALVSTIDLIVFEGFLSQRYKEHLKFKDSVRNFWQWNTGAYAGTRLMHKSAKLKYL